MQPLHTLRCLVATILVVVGGGYAAEDSHGSGTCNAGHGDELSAKGRHAALLQKAFTSQSAAPMQKKSKLEGKSTLAKKVVNTFTLFKKAKVTKVKNKDASLAMSKKISLDEQSYKKASDKVTARQRGEAKRKEKATESATSKEKNTAKKSAKKQMPVPQIEEPTSLQTMMFGASIGIPLFLLGCGSPCGAQSPEDREEQFIGKMPLSD